MAPALRMRYELWRTECDAIHNRYEREGGPGAAYAAMLNGAFVTPDPPKDVAAALGLDDPPHIPADATAEQLAAMYATMLGD